MIAFLLLAVAFSIQQTAEEEAVGCPKGWDPVPGGGCRDAGEVATESEEALGFPSTMCVYGGGRWTGTRCVHADEEEEEEEVGWMVNTSHDYGRRTYWGANCFAHDMEAFPWKCHEAAECEWGTRCKKECGFKNLAKDCSGVTISTCKSMGKSESRCIGYGCVCDMTLQECVKKGFTEDYCAEAGCVDAEDEANTCKCDSRGVQPNSKHGAWCWLASTPCVLLTGEAADTTWSWARCEYDGKAQLECEGVEQALASTDVKYPDEEEEEELGWMVNTSHDYGHRTYFGTNCYAKEMTSLYYKCVDDPVCEWKTYDCKETCSFRNLAEDCSGITISRCMEMKKSESQCVAYGCTCEWSMTECKERGHLEADCAKAGCVDEQVCTCDHRGRQAHKDGDWCYLAETPCTRLNGKNVPGDWTWVDCEYNGETQVDCGQSEKAVGFTYSMCVQSGGRWTGTRCIHAESEKAVGFPDTACIMSGGRWTGSRCVRTSVAQALADASTVAVKTSNDGPSFAVSALAVLGLGALLYGAGRYYLSK